VDIANIIYDTCETIIESNKPGNDYKNFEYEYFKYFGTEPSISEDDFHRKSLKDLIKILYPQLLSLYKERSERNAAIAYPVIKNVYEDKSNQFERIVIPFSDGQKGLNITTDLKEAYETEGKQIIVDFEKNISLAIIDDAWKTHLRQMDELKQSVQLATHEQKDPLLIFKFEAYNLFKSMVDKVNKEIVAFLFHAQLPTPENSVQEAHEVRRAPEHLQTSKEEILNSDELAQRNREAGEHASPAPQVTEPIIRSQPKIGRNDKVTIQNILNGETKEMKYKQALPLLEKGEWVIKR
jgi:Preprotein translocase subunit SecA (ATPase, RNA helicase)